MIKELEIVALVCDLPGHGLVSGDIGTVVFDYAATSPGPAYEVEFMALDGNTIAVVSLDAGAVRPVRNREIAHVRQVA
jgi:hypothetical protein